jgi:hypothetical protein
MQDTLLGGRFSINMQEQQLEYRKKLAAPNGSHLVLQGSCSYAGYRPSRPTFGLHVEFGGDTETPAGHANAVWVGNSLEVRQRVSLLRGLGLEVCGSMTVPTPTARYLPENGTLALGEGAFRLHIAEVNCILRI